MDCTPGPHEGERLARAGNRWQDELLGLSGTRAAISCSGIILLWWLIANGLECGLDMPRMLRLYHQWLVGTSDNPWNVLHVAVAPCAAVRLALQAFLVARILRYPQTAGHALRTIVTIELAFRVLWHCHIYFGISHGAREWLEDMLSAIPPVCVLLWRASLWRRGPVFRVRTIQGVALQSKQSLLAIRSLMLFVSGGFCATLILREWHAMVAVYRFFKWVASGLTADLGVDMYSLDRAIAIQLILWIAVGIMFYSHVRPARCARALTVFCIATSCYCLLDVVSTVRTDISAFELASVAGVAGAYTGMAVALLACYALRSRALENDDAVCRYCGYLLWGVDSPRCPECGTRI